MKKRSQKAPRKSTKKPYKKRKKSNNKIYRFFLFFMSLLIIVLSIVIYYALFIFPEKLRISINTDIINLYNSEYYEISDNILLIKLLQKPDYSIQLKLFDMIRNKYGLETNFQKITAANDKGINQISFYKNNNLYKDINPIYIYWNNIDEIIIDKKNIIKNTDISTAVKNNKKAVNTEHLEYKIKKIKKEKLVKPDIDQFQKPDKKYLKSDKVKIAIVIDDLGYSYNSAYDFLTLGFPVTFACIPEMEYSDYFYNLFRQYGYDIMIHLPLEPLKGKKYVETNAIFTEMSEIQIRNKILKFLDLYPESVGVNNHMGSKAVSDARVMNVIFKELKIKNIFWLDSRTTDNTVAKEVANLNNLSYYKRDVFLDNDKDYESIKKSMELLIRNAKKNKKSVGIGHIQTKQLVAVLKEYYLKSDELGIEFIFLKDM